MTRYQWVYVINIYQELTGFSLFLTLDSNILLNSPSDLSSDATRFAGQGPEPWDCSWRLTSLTIFWSLRTQKQILLQNLIIYTQRVARKATKQNKAKTKLSSYFGLFADSCRCDVELDKLLSYSRPLQRWKKKRKIKQSKAKECFPFTKTGRPERPVCQSNALFWRDGAAKSWKIITPKIVRAILKKFEGQG